MIPIETEMTMSDFRRQADLRTETYTGACSQAISTGSHAAILAGSTGQRDELVEKTRAP
jgi:hypothetical protein